MDRLPDSDLEGRGLDVDLAPESRLGRAELVSRLEEEKAGLHLLIPIHHLRQRVERVLVAFYVRVDSSVETVGLQEIRMPRRC